MYIIDANKVLYVSNGCCANATLHHDLLRQGVSEEVCTFVVSMRLFLFHHLNQKVFLPALRVRQE